MFPPSICGIDCGNTLTGHLWFLPHGVVLHGKFAVGLFDFCSVGGRVGCVKAEEEEGIEGVGEGQQLGLGCHAQGRAKPVGA